MPITIQGLFAQSPIADEQLKLIGVSCEDSFEPVLTGELIPDNIPNSICPLDVRYTIASCHTAFQACFTTFVSINRIVMHSRNDTE